MAYETSDDFSTIPPRPLNNEADLGLLNSWLETEENFKLFVRVNKLKGMTSANHLTQRLNIYRSNGVEGQGAQTQTHV